MTTCKLTIPARVNILGNPSDANEGDFATISAAVEPYAYAEISPTANYTLEQTDSLVPPLMFKPVALPFSYDGSHDLLKGALNRLTDFSAELREKLPQQGFHFKVYTNVPRQSGLGGSSLLVLLMLAALREFYALDRHIHNDYILSELCQRVEEAELGIAAGFADRYVPLFGGLAYLDYRGKLHHKTLFDEPLTTYERLDRHVASLPLIAVTTGVRHNSGDVHGRMRPRYLEEDAAWQKQGGEMPPMVQFMTKAWETAWRGKIALLHNDLPTFGDLMKQNHHTVDAMMRYCGFDDGAGWANNLFINAALKNGALGAKLTGAGGGGSVFALVKSGQEEKLIQAWRKTADDHNLNKAQIYPLKIVEKGLRVERFE